MSFKWPSPPMGANVADVEIDIVEGAGRGALLRAPDRVVSAVVGFMARHD